MTQKVRRPSRRLRLRGSVAVLTALAVIGGGGAAVAAPSGGSSADVAKYVNPFVGTAPQEGSPMVFGGVGAGNTFPGATAPFGMVQWSPDTVESQPGGYSYADDQLTGFSLTHVSGGGCPSLGDIPFMPHSGTVTTSPATHPADYVAGFSHDNESASPGSYAVTMDDGIGVDLTATARTGMGTFTYPGDEATMLVDVAGSAAGTDAADVKIGKDTISGSATSGGFCGSDQQYRIYFSASFNRPFDEVGTWEDDDVTPGARTARGGADQDEKAGSGAYITFDTRKHHDVTVRVGVSYVSVENAKANLAAESTGSLEKIQERTRASWNERLGAIEASGGTPKERSTFYTSLYHTFMAPNVYSDVDGSYQGADGTVHTVSRRGHAEYANYSGWDVYRSQIQLIALLAPDETSDMMQSMVDTYDQGGELPKWSLENGESYIMVGDPAAAMIADAYAFGARDFDTDAALDAMVAQATEQSTIRPGYHYIPELGYLPADGDYSDECCHFYGATSTSLEYNTADFAVAQLAGALGKDKIRDRFLDRSEAWKNLFNPETGYIQPRDADGSFVAPFDPSAMGNDYVEGNAAQYTWMVPFDVAGLADQIGGRKPTEKRLDTFLTEINAGYDKPYAWLGNEPNANVPWLYDYVGAPYKAQEQARRAMKELYYPGPGGLAGNDDLGQMSSWYVWAAIGMYPQVPGRAELALNSPLFSKVTIHGGNGQQITIKAQGAATDAPFVQHLSVNGTSTEKTWLPASFVRKGGVMDYRLSTTPSTNWGTSRADAPPSFS